MEREKPQPKNYWDRNYKNVSERYYSQAFEVGKNVDERIELFVKRKRQEGVLPTTVFYGEFDPELKTVGIHWKDGELAKHVLVHLIYGKDHFASKLEVKGIVFKTDKKINADNNKIHIQSSFANTPYYTDINQGFTPLAKSKFTRSLTKSVEGIQHVTAEELTEDFSITYLEDWDPKSEKTIFKIISEDHLK